MLKFSTPAVLALCLGAPALASNRLEAVVQCVATQTALDYDCTIRLTRGGAPVEGAILAVTPDMPSMPMAHNIAPMPAEAGDAPGDYIVPLTLDMHGRWVLKIEISAPSRDLVVVDHEFEPE